MFWKYWFIGVFFIQFLFFGFCSIYADDGEEFIKISKQMEKNFAKIISAKTATVTYLIRELKPVSDEEIKSVENLLKEKEEKENKAREKYIEERKRKGRPVGSDEAYKKYQKESRERLFATLTATERVYLTSYYYKEKKVRQEEILFSDNRQLHEILQDIQKNPETIKGQLRYNINDGNYVTTYAEGTHPLDLAEKDRIEFTASAVLDKDIANQYRSKAQVGLPSKSEQDELDFLKFGVDFIAPSLLKNILDATKVPITISYLKENNEQVIECLLGKKGKNNFCFILKVLPEKNYVISSMSMMYNDHYTIDYKFDDFIRITPELWIPKHIILKNRVSNGDDKNAFKITEFLAVVPMAIGIELSDSLFEINLTQEEKNTLEKSQQISVNRRASIKQDDSLIVHDTNTTWIRIIFIILGIIFICFGILFRKKKF
ncbi:MAG: hypothetical protein LBG58_14950 [Planctomycetaceae bacterium]|jgi:hypothetical protein|nr:hypothetical protein [Planctomycetaceae bacterium]